MIKLIHEDGSTEILKPKEKEQKKEAKKKVVVNWTDEERPKSIPKPSNENAKPENPDNDQSLDTDQENYDQIIVKMGEVYRHKQRMANHLADVYETAGLERRKAVVEEIKELRAQYNELFHLKDHFERHGVFPEQKGQKPKLTDLQKHELLRRRGNVSANISKAKNMVKKYQHNPEKLVKYQSKQASLEAEIEEIDGLLR